MPVWLNKGLEDLGVAAIFSVAGVILLVFFFRVVDMLSPAYDFRKELLENRNVALAIVLGAGILGISIIVAASMLG